MEHSYSSQTKTYTEPFLDQSQVLSDLRYPDMDIFFVLVLAQPEDSVAFCI